MRALSSKSILPITSAADSIQSMIQSVKKPLIGLFCNVDDEKRANLAFAYVNAIESVGGIPLIIPYVEGESTLDSILDLFDGFLFTGGDDIDPSRYGEETKSTCGAIQHYRDALEFLALEKILRTEKPILAICRGAQLVNVAFGGTLYQDIPTECPSNVLHRQEELRFQPSHGVTVLKDTPLWDLVSCDHMVSNSFHHQAVKDLGRDLVCMALAEDGIVEAFSMKGSQYLRAYQWHPECLFETDADNRLLFSDFIKACNS